MKTTAPKKKDSPADTTPAAADKRRPVHTIRMEDVSGSIWDRVVQVKGAPRTFLSCTFERSYKDRDGTWKYTKTFDPDSLGALVNVIQQAEAYMRSLEYPEAETIPGK